MENKSRILVIGGTGKTGRKVVQKLDALNQNVRVGSRNASPSFEWENPDTWSLAMDGIDKMYVVFYPDLAVPGSLEAIESITKQAKRSGVKKIVLLSGKGEREAELCEQVVVHSGIDYTIVRASWFMQNFSESFFLEPILDGFVALPQAEVKIPFVDTDDIADVVVEALLHEEHNGQIYQLTGSRQLTFKEVMEEISFVTGKEIAFTPISLSAYKAAMEQQGIPADYIWLVNYLFSEVLGNPTNSEVSNDIEKVLGRKPKNFSEYVRETVATGIWMQQ